jgi:hypothetical protein
VALALARTIKEGDNMTNVAQYYLQLGTSDLALITNMGSTQAVPTADQARKVRGN